MSQEQHDRRMFNEGVLFGLRYLLMELRGQVRGVENDIEKVQRGLSDPLADETPFDLWLDEEEDRNLERSIATMKVSHTIRTLGS